MECHRAFVAVAHLVTMFCVFQMCHGQKSLYWGWDGHPTLIGMGPYKPLRNWVDDHPLLYGNNRS